jgi:hypothetical protein
MSRGKKCAIGVGLFVILAGAGAWYRSSLMAWWFVAELAQAATPEDRARCVKRVTSLDMAAVPRLLDLLRRTEESCCQNAGAALVHLGNVWGEEDPRTLAVVQQFESGLDSFSVAGQKSCLEVTVELLRCRRPDSPAPPAALMLAAGNLLKQAADRGELRAPALSLAGGLVERAHPGQWLDLCRTLALHGLKDADPSHRVLAIHLTLHAARRAQSDWLHHVVPLLRDPAARVRRAAVVTLGAARETVSEDDLLALLHDDDLEVCRLCETALRSRGLTENHILLGKLISDERATARLEVFQHLQRAADLEPGVWLRRLCQDSSAAVRAAAIRAAMTQTRVDLRSHVVHMAQQDPSPTVRQVAQHYLGRPPARGEHD